MNSEGKTYTRRLMIGFTAIFVAFASALLAFRLQQERQIRRLAIQERLEGYADILYCSMNNDSIDFETLSSILPDHLRTTVMDVHGNVSYDSEDSGASEENHLERKEVREALENATGTAVRRSATTDKDYFYLARRYGDVVVRVALPFDSSGNSPLKPDWLFLCVAVLLIAAFIGLIIIMSGRFGKGMSESVEIQNRKMKQQMTSNVAHELRTPVTSIRGYLETLVSCPDLPAEKQRNFIGRAYAQALRLSDLIRDMALISKIEESPQKLVKEPVLLRPVWDEVVEEFSTEITMKAVRIRCSLLENLEIVANRTLVHAIFRNLLENSLKYAGVGITVHMECLKQTSDSFYFTYYDNGCGVPAEHLPKIFERFHRVSEGRSRDDGGSGLGLSIVRNAVAFHGGEIKAVNRDGGGLQFFFTLANGRKE